MHTEEMYFVFFRANVSITRGRTLVLLTATGLEFKKQSEFPPADENAVARSQLSAGTSTDGNASTTYNDPAGRNDIEGCYLPVRGSDQTGKQISKQQN
jgi:hypothetical protein